MRTLVLALLLVVCQAGYSQIAGFKTANEAVIKLNDLTIKPGDTLQLNYGSRADKSFAFVSAQYGSGLMAGAGAIPYASPQYAKLILVVESIQYPKKRPGYYIPVCRPIEHAMREYVVWMQVAQAFEVGEVTKL